MSKGPESNFWASLRQNLPKTSFAVRIENKAGGGVPDVHLLLDKLPLWLELKTTKGSAVSVSAPQVAWHVANMAHGGLSFFLVKSLYTGIIYLYPGSKAPELAREGLRSGSHIAEISRSNQVFDALRPHVFEHYSRVMLVAGSAAPAPPAPRPCGPAANDSVAQIPQ
jgi:hypothetical protein